MLDTGRLELLQRLLQTAADDLHRAFTATWSTARLRTLLVHACLDAGHQVVEPAVPGVPARAKHAPRAARPADLEAIRRDGAHPLAVDLLTGSGGAGVPWDRPGGGPVLSRVEGPHGGNTSLSLASAHRGIERVSSGAIDALLISADAQAYERLFESAAGRAAGRQRQAVATVLPRAANIAREKAHTCILGDATVATVGREVRAFGITRLACAVYVMPY
jgi:hypothetical protein